MSGGDGLARKQEYFNKLIGLLDEYPKIIIVGADNVGSAHMQKIRQALRATSVVLMGKNTMIRKAIRGHIQNNPKLEALLPYVRGNIGFIFTKGDLSKVKKIVEEQKVEAPAKAGSIAPCDVIVPAGNTGLEPTKTSFLQALNIGSKIARGQVEILNDVHLIKFGQKVGNSESALLGMLNIKPFRYGLQVKNIYDDGAVYEPKVLDITDNDLLQKFHAGVRNIAALGLQIGYPTVASLPHSILRGYKKALAISLATDYTIPQAEKLKAYLANPSAFAATAAPTAATTAAPAASKEDKPAPKVEEKKESSDEDMGLGLFD